IAFLEVYHQDRTHAPHAPCAKEAFMTTMTVQLRSIPDTKAALGWAGGHTIVVDRPDGKAGGLGLGFNGRQLLGLAIGGCFCNDLQYVAHDMGILLASVHSGADNLAVVGLERDNASTKFFAPLLFRPICIPASRGPISPDRPQRHTCSAGNPSAPRRGHLSSASRHKAAGIRPTPSTKLR